MKNVGYEWIARTGCSPLLCLLHALDVELTTSKMSQEQQRLGCQLQGTALLHETERSGGWSASTPTFAFHHMWGQGRWGTCVKCESLGDLDTLVHCCLTNSHASSPGWRLLVGLLFTTISQACHIPALVQSGPVKSSWRVSADFSGCWTVALERIKYLAEKGSVHPRVQSPCWTWTYIWVQYYLHFWRHKVGLQQRGPRSTICNTDHVTVLTGTVARLS